MGARHSCRFSVNHYLVCNGGHTFWTVERAEPRLGNKRRAPVSRSHHFNCIVPGLLRIDGVEGSGENLLTIIAPGNMTGCRSVGYCGHVFVNKLIFDMQAS
jgi:hypothetical protein